MHLRRRQRLWNESTKAVVGNELLQRHTILYFQVRRYLMQHVYIKPYPSKRSKRVCSKRFVSPEHSNH